MIFPNRMRPDVEPVFLFRSGKMRHLLDQLLPALSFAIILHSCDGGAIRLESPVFCARDSSHYLIIENAGAESVHLSMVINGVHLGSIDSLLTAVHLMPSDSGTEPLERRTWRFAMEHMASLNPLTDAQWQDDPLLMIGSVGFGKCDHLASVLTELWGRQGFRTRLWWLGGHVVSEVFADGRWQMYDSSLGVFYLNRDGRVASVEELVSDPALITSPLKKLPVRKRQLFIHHSRAYSSEVASLYARSSDNRSEHVLERGPLTEGLLLHLPPGSRAELPVRLKDAVWIDGYHGNRWQPPAFVRYTLPDDWEGVMHLPFLIVSVTGKGTAVLEGDTFDIGSIALNDRLREFRRYPRQIALSNITGQTVVHCLINDLLFNDTGADRMVLNGRGLDGIRVEKAADDRGHPYSGGYDVIGQHISRLATTYQETYMAIGGRDRFEPSMAGYRALLTALQNEMTVQGTYGKDLGVQWDSLLYLMGNDDHPFIINTLESNGSVALTAAMLQTLPASMIATAAKVQAAKVRNHRSK